MIRPMSIAIRLQTRSRCPGGCTNRVAGRLSMSRAIDRGDRGCRHRSLSGTQYEIHSGRLMTTPSHGQPTLWRSEPVILASRSRGRARLARRRRHSLCRRLRGSTRDARTRVLRPARTGWHESLRLKRRGAHLHVLSRSMGARRRSGSGDGRHRSSQTESRIMRSRNCAACADAIINCIQLRRSRRTGSGFHPRRQQRPFDYRLSARTSCHLRGGSRRAG